MSSTVVVQHLLLLGVTFVLLWVSTSTSEPKWKTWESWGNCTKSCGGYRTRIRRCEVYRKCFGRAAQATACKCRGVWGNWTEWSPCSKSCGPGIQSRNRSCIGNASCVGPRQEHKACFKKTCPVAGGWNAWSKWAACSATCGNGTSHRSRQCNHPAPARGGAPCSGKATESKPCSARLCSVNGGWGGWTPWKKCTRTCGGGRTSRIRSCNSPKPSNGGANCPGATAQTKGCNTQLCRVDGGFGAWSKWSGCSASCGGGHKTRTRVCDSPRPANGGKRCQSNSAHVMKCNVQACRIDGGWGAPSNWSRCSASCGNGTQSRTRKCDSPVPANGGRACPGNSTVYRNCAARKCAVPINGGWGKWGGTSECSVTCGQGSRYRQRRCDNPKPANGGRKCVGNATETIVCKQAAQCPPKHCISLDCTDAALVKNAKYTAAKINDALCIFCQKCSCKSYKIYGFEKYTQNSNPCCAMQQWKGRVYGTHCIKKLPGQRSYAAKTKNSITSKLWGPSGGTFQAISNNQDCKAGWMQPPKRR